MEPVLDLGSVEVEARRIARRTALLSIDLETDYGTGLDEALAQTGRLLDLLARLGLPLTAFVEGQFFERRKPLCRMLLDAGVDVQLHCYDHADPGDTPASLRRGASALEDVTGRPAAGYRAHTYRLTRELYDTLLALDFRWDSSLLRAYGQNANRHPRVLDGDYFVLDGRLFEFPLATWGAVPLAFSHAYRLLLGAPLERLLWALAGTGPLAAYNMHMTDLVRSGSLRHAKRRRLSRLLHRRMWALRGPDTFGSLEAITRRLRRAGYEFLSTHALYERVAIGV